MTEEKRRYAIVWDAIERMAFRPVRPKTWLSLYKNTLPRLWGLQDGDVKTRINSGFDADFLNISCEYRIEEMGKYSGTISMLADASRAIWTIHVDPDFISKSALYNAAERYPDKDRKRHLRGDIQAVLEGMLFHPRHHSHLEDLGVTTTLMETINHGVHQVRIGGNIENAYVFLYHLRYQFCIVSDSARQEEQNRLIDLFMTAILENSHTVPAGKLFNFKR